MSVLWAANEDISFPHGTWPLLNTNYVGLSNRYVMAAGLNVTANPTFAPCIGKTWPGGAITSGWLHFRGGGSITNFSTNSMIAGLTHSSKTMGEGLWLAADSPVSRLRLGTWNGTAFTELATETGNSLGVNGSYNFDMQFIDYGDSAAEVNVYFQGALVINYTGDIDISGLSSLNRVAFYGDNTNSRFLFSEFVVADEDTRQMRAHTLYLSGTGGTNQCTGAYTDIDEATSSDADVIYSNGTDQVFQGNLSALYAGNWGVRGVIETVRAAKSADSTPTGLAIGVLSGTSSDDGTSSTLSIVYDTYERLMTINPTTTSGWSSAEVDALQLQLKTKA